MRKMSFLDMVENRKNFLEALNGNKTNSVPFWFMRQAGRYLPEYRQLRSKSGGFLEMVYKPEVAVEITLQPIRRFGMDAAIIFSDILVVPHALGQSVSFVEGEGPKLEPFRSAFDFSKLNFSKFDAVLSPVYETLKGVRANLKKEGFSSTATIGFSGSPWTLACYMVEGQGSREFVNVKKLAYQDPQSFSHLIDILIEAVSAYLIRQIENGAEAVQIFDSWAGVLDGQQFRKWVIIPTKKIVSLVRDVYPYLPIIGFPKSAGNNVLSYIQDTGVTAVGLDSQYDTKWVARVIQNQVPVQGNLDPICLLSGGDALLMAAEKIIEDLSNGPFIFNLGHGIHKDTPVENVELLVEYIKSYVR